MGMGPVRRSDAAGRRADISMGMGPVWRNVAAGRRAVLCASSRDRSPPTVSNPARTVRSGRPG
jgi:hypothetical protein